MLQSQKDDGYQKTTGVKQMGNVTNDENWAAQERLRAIERAVWWRGWIKRKDLSGVFGVSMAQASADIQKYLEMNPAAMVYHMSHKRYERADHMECVLQHPDFDDAVRCFLSFHHLGTLARMSMGASGTSHDDEHKKVATVGLPSRTGNLKVQRAIIQSLINNEQLKIKYWSLSSGKSSWRQIRLVGLGHDGYRWHVRAWCYEREGFRDFVISRISATKEVESLLEMPEEDDVDWFTIDTVRLKPNSELQENERRAIELDYGIRKNGVLKIKVRRAMREYLLAHMRVSSLDLKNHFELDA